MQFSNWDTIKETSKNWEKDGENWENNCVDNDGKSFHRYKQSYSYSSKILANFCKITKFFGSLFYESENL